MRVRALETGFDGLMVREPGEEFEMPDDSFDHKNADGTAKVWFEKISGGKKPGTAEKAQGKTAKELIASLPELSDADLRAVVQAEKDAGDDSRPAVITAVEAEQKKREIAANQGNTPTAKDIIAKVPTMTDEQLTAALAFEANLGDDARKSVVDAATAEQNKRLA